MIIRNEKVYSESHALELAGKLWNQVWIWTHKIQALVLDEYS